MGASQDLRWELWALLISGRGKETRPKQFPDAKPTRLEFVFKQLGEMLAWHFLFRREPYSRNTFRELPSSGGSNPDARKAYIGNRWAAPKKKFVLLFLRLENPNGEPGITKTGELWCGGGGVDSLCEAEREFLQVHMCSL